MSKTRRILSLGYEIPSNDPNVCECWDYYNEELSLSDYDYVVICPKIKSNSHSDKSRAYWNAELKAFLNRGGVLFVMLCKNVIEYYGGSFAPVSISNYDILPCINVSFVNSCGVLLESKNSLVNKLYSTFKDCIEYRVHISGNIEATFKSKDGAKVLGGNMSYGRGYIVFLPYIDLSQSYGEDFVEEDQYTDIELKSGHKLISCLNDVYNTLASKETQLPEWLSNPIYFTRNYAIVTDKIADIDEKIVTLLAEKDNLESELRGERELSELLYETGKPLERAVSKALYILGYTKAENFNNGHLELDQVIESPEGDRFIGECEGKDNSAIAIDKLRQLSDSIFEDLENDDVDDKAYGLLFGNPQRLLAPEIRTLTFTDKCLRAATRSNIGLILTKDLFKVAKYIADSGDIDYARKCRRAIVDGLGGVIVFPDLIY